MRKRRLTPLVSDTELEIAIENIEMGLPSNQEFKEIMKKTNHPKLVITYETREDIA